MRERLRQSDLWGLIPFLGFTLVFLLWPTARLLGGAFYDAHGQPSWAGLRVLTEPGTWSALTVSLQLSAASALLGGLGGTALAWAAVRGVLPRWVRTITLTFSGVASNFAGIPLAFAFLATLGRVGLVTGIMRQLGCDLYSTDFDLLSFWGLTLSYLYFQMPLMVLVMTPALDGLRQEWREACAMLGAGAWVYRRRVAWPILAPSVLGGLLLLFANAFGAVATAYALTGSSLNILPILLYAQIRGDVLHNPQVGYVLAWTMIVVTAACNLAFLMLQARAQRHVRKG